MRWRNRRPQWWRFASAYEDQYNIALDYQALHDRVCEKHPTALLLEAYEALELKLEDAVRNQLTRVQKQLLEDPDGQWGYRPLYQWRSTHYEYGHAGMDTPETLQFLCGQLFLHKLGEPTIWDPICHCNAECALCPRAH